MKVFNENKTAQISSYDLDKGMIVNEVFNNEIILVYKPYTEEQLKRFENERKLFELKENQKNA